MDVQNTPAGKAQGALWERRQKRRQKGSKSRKNRGFAVRLYSLVMSEAMAIQFHQHGCGDGNNRHAEVGGGVGMRTQPYTENSRKLRSAGNGEILFSREEHTSGQP